MSSIDYNSLLNQSTLVSWLNGIASNDPNPTIRTAAREIAFEVTGNKNIASWPYYKELYDKYKFELKITNTNNGLGIVLYAKTKDNYRLIGNVANNKQIVEVPKGYTKPLPPTIIVESPTEERRPNISGVSQTNYTISIYIDSVLNGTTNIEIGNSYVYVPVANLSANTHKITATATSPQGLVSDMSSPVEVTIQGSLPKPTVYVTSPTYDRTPTITGASFAAANITVYDGVTSIGTTTASGGTSGTAGTSGTGGVSGTWSFTPNSDLDIGSHTITATASDNYSTSGNSNPKTLIIQAVPVPVINVTSPSYSFSTTITGTAVPNSKLNFYIDDLLVDILDVDSNGNWSYTTTLGVGTFYFKATTTISGSTSNFSSTVELVIQILSSPSISVTSPTYDKTPTITGTSVATSTITIYIDDVSQGTTTTDGGGNWSFIPDSELSIGVHSITATSSIADQISDPSSPVELTIEVVPIPILSVTSPTYDRTPTITGTSVASATITVYDGVTSLGTTTANGGGSWSFTPGTNLSISTHSITATATIYGSTSSSSLPSTLIIEGVESPNINSITATYDKTPTITGTSVASATITVYDGVTSLGTTTANGGGSWSFTPGTNLSVGSHSITATATVSGNTSDVSSPQTLIIQGAPTVSFTSPTSDQTPTISGTSLPSATVTIYDGVSSLGTTSADGSGNWTFTPGSNLNVGSHSITANALLNGNTSETSSPQTLVILLTDLLTAIIAEFDSIL